MSYNFLLNQEDLETLCKDRELKTNELHTPNDYYGQATILKNYVGLPDYYPLKVILQHGLTFSDFLWDVDCSARLPVFFSPSAYRAELYRKQTAKPSIPIGFGFLYAIENFLAQYESHLKNFHRQGTIVFPSHSTHHITTKFNFSDYSQKLENIPDKLKPVVVCIYWKDYLLGHHLEYINRGFKVVTAGHIYDPLFLLRLYDICRNFKYSTSNDIGTHLCASVYSGCNFFYTDVLRIYLDNPKQLPMAHNLNYREIKNKSIELFNKPADHITFAQKSFIDEYMGTKYFQNRKELKRLIIYAELCDKLLSRFSVGHGILDSLPTYFQRHSDKIKTKITRIVQNLVTN